MSKKTEPAVPEVSQEPSPSAQPLEAEIGEVEAIPIVSYHAPTKRERALQYALEFYERTHYELPEIRKEDHTLYTPAERLVREAKVVEAYLYPAKD